MGLISFVRSLKKKTQDVMLEKALEQMRDMKMPVPEKAVRKLIPSHMLTLPGVKSAAIDIRREGLRVQVKYRDGRPTERQFLRFVELVWTGHKRAFVFQPDPPFEYQKAYGIYAGVVTCLAAVLRQMLNVGEAQLKAAQFTSEIGPGVSGVIEKEGKLWFEPRRVPLLRQYMYFRIMGQPVMDHVNITDCWFENGRIMVRIDNNRVVDRIKQMNLDPEQLRRMLRGDMSALTSGGVR
ncbi:MAG: hypothetical protein N2595_02070 [bacterium]|nr:hypothetical protein [bacterium]